MLCFSTLLFFLLSVLFLPKFELKRLLQLQLVANLPYWHFGVSFWQQGLKENELETHRALLQFANNQFCKLLTLFTTLQEITTWMLLLYVTSYGPSVLTTFYFYKELLNTLSEFRKSQATRHATSHTSASTKHRKPSYWFQIHNTAIRIVGGRSQF